VLPFTPQQVKNFLHKWYRAAERQEAPPAERAAANARGTAAADHLLGQIDAVPGLHDLTVNPLLLTMIANVHRYRQWLPENRAALYSEVCTVMVGQRDREKGIPARSSGPEQRLSLLGRLAFHWMRLGIRDLDRRALLETLRPWLAETAPQITAEVFYNEHRPHQGIANARPVAPLPEPITDPDRLAHLNIHRHDRVGGILHEYEHAA
jgi:hypothetical protein